MFIFGHIGITLGVALAGKLSLIYLQKRSRLKPGNIAEKDTRAEEKKTISSSGRPDAADRVPSPDFRAGSDYITGRGNNSTLKRLEGFFDLRFWAIGSMLPDIIDKPVGHLFFRETFQNNGRIFSHTLVFLALLLIAGLLLNHFKNKMWVLALAGGTFMHLMLDSMWRNPQTFLWPSRGWAFPPYYGGDWLSNVFRALLHDPGTFIPEIIGLLVLGITVLVLVIKRKSISSLIRRED